MPRAHGTYPGLVSPHVPRHSLPSTLDRPASSLSCLSLLRYIGCCAVSFGLKPGFVTWGTPKSLPAEACVLQGLSCRPDCPTSCRNAKAIEISCSELRGAALGSDD